MQTLTCPRCFLAVAVTPGTQPTCPGCGYPGPDLRNRGMAWAKGRAGAIAKVVGLVVLVVFVAAITASVAHGPRSEGPQTPAPTGTAAERHDRPISAVAVYAYFVNLDADAEDEAVCVVTAYSDRVAYRTTTYAGTIDVAVERRGADNTTWTPAGSAHRDVTSLSFGPDDEVVVPLAVQFDDQATYRVHVTVRAEGQEGQFEDRDVFTLRAD